MTEPKEPKKGTILELATKMDASVRDIETSRKAVDKATAALATATEEHSTAVATLTALHAEYQAFMNDMLSAGGTVHVAQP